MRSTIKAKRRSLSPSSFYIALLFFVSANYCVAQLDVSAVIKEKENPMEEKYPFLRRIAYLDSVFLEFTNRDSIRAYDLLVSSWDVGHTRLAGFRAPSSRSNSLIILYDSTIITYDSLKLDDCPIVYGVPVLKRVQPNTTFKMCFLVGGNTFASIQEYENWRFFNRIWVRFFFKRSDSSDIDKEAEYINDDCLLASPIASYNDYLKKKQYSSRLFSVNERKTPVGFNCDMTETKFNNYSYLKSFLVNSQYLVPEYKP